MANKVRTKIHEITQNTHFGQELKDNNYQKSQMMLDIVNQAIAERKLGEYGGNMGNSIIGKATGEIKDKLAKGQTVSPADRKAAAQASASALGGRTKQTQLALAVPLVGRQTASATWAMPSLPQTSRSAPLWATEARWKRRAF